MFARLLIWQALESVVVVLAAVLTIGVLWCVLLIARWVFRWGGRHD